MAHLQYMPGDPRLVDQLVYELKSKGIFDQFRKDCIADVDTKPAYQNLRQRVESSVSTFLSRQCWQPDLNKNQLREKLRKHILDGNYLEQGVERIVDQVVNPKVASVFIPQVEDLVYNYLGITRKKSVTTAETSNEKIENLLPTDLEAVSPGSVKSNEGGDDKMDIDSSVADETKMEFDEQEVEVKEESSGPVIVNQGKDEQVSELCNNKETTLDSNKDDIPLPSEEIKIENIPPPENSPPQIDVSKIKLPKVSPDIPLPDSIIVSANIPLPDEIPKDVKDEYFKTMNSDEDESSSDSSLRRNMSPLTPIRNFNNENSCDAQQAFENDLGNTKDKDQKEPSTFRFAIETKAPEKEESIKIEKKEIEQINLSYQFNHQVNINNFNTPLYEDSSNSNNLQIDYESDANSKANLEVKVNEEQSLDDSKKDRKVEDKKSSHKSSHRSRDSSKYSSSKDRRSDSKPSSSRDSSRHDKKNSREDSKSKSSHKERSSDKSDKKDSDKKERDSSKHRSSHKSSSHKDSKSHKSSSSSSSQRRSSSTKHSEEKKSSSSSNHRDKSEKSSERSSDKSSRDRSSKDSKSSSHRSDKDKKSSSSKSSSKHDDKDKDKKNKKESDDHYGLSGRGNATRRSTDRDSNDGSSSSKGSHNPSSSKSSSSQKDSKGNSSKSDNTSPSGESTSPSDKENVLKETKKSDKDIVQPKPIVRIDTRLELPMASPPRLPFVPDVTLRKPKIAANLEEAKKLMKMRRFLDEEQKRMNQEAALLLEFQANVRPSLSQVYSSIPGPELEFACVINNEQTPVLQNNPCVGDSLQQNESILISNPTNALLAVVNAQNIEDITDIDPGLSNLTENNDSMGLNNETIPETEINETKLPHETDASKEVTKYESEQSNVHTHEDSVEILDVAETRIPDVGNDIDEIKGIIPEDNTITILGKGSYSAGDSQLTPELDLEVIKEKSEKEDNDNRTEYFEITVIAEELSENEETQNTIMRNFENDNQTNDIAEDHENLPLDNNNTVIMKIKETEDSQCLPDEQNLQYFTESEKHEAELQKARFDMFLKAYTEKQSNDKIYLINCDSYEESIIKGVLETLGSFDIVNYQRNGHLKLPKTTKSIVKNVNVASEVSLPFDNNEFEAAANELEMDLKVTRQTVLSPVKSECSFELSNDYDAKIDEMVNNASRQEIMEIILGNAMSSESPSKMPRIDYVSESNIDSEEVNGLKRKLTEVETTVNNNRPVLTPRKLRKVSASDQITSTTEESEPPPSNNIQNNTRSKYLGRARRVGLPKPRKTDQPKSPSSDKSVENYEQNTKAPTALPPTPNGKMKTPQRNKIQRYDTSDLYKPKLHYLSRRNNIN